MRQRTSIRSFVGRFVGRVTHSFDDSHVANIGLLGLVRSKKKKRKQKKDFERKKNRPFCKVGILFAKSQMMHWEGKSSKKEREGGGGKGGYNKHVNITFYYNLLSKCQGLLSLWLEDSMIGLREHLDKKLAKHAEDALIARWDHGSMPNCLQSTGVSEK